MLQRDERRGFKEHNEFQCSCVPHGLRCTNTHTHTHTHTYGLSAHPHSHFQTFKPTQTNGWRDRRWCMPARRHTHMHIQSWLPELWCVQYCEWRDWFLGTEFIYIFLLFLTASAHLIFFFSPLTNFPMLNARVCAYACAHTPPVNVCVIVCYYRGEREKLVFFKEHPQN